MQLQRVHLQNYKRFTDLTITGLPDTARLIVLAGPNGRGKSSLFDAFRSWHGMRSTGWGGETEYHVKKGTPFYDWEQQIQIELYQPYPDNHEQRKRAFYIRSAYRNDSEFRIDRLERTGAMHEQPVVSRMIDDNKLVALNYRVVVSQTISGLFAETDPTATVFEVRERLIGTVRDSVKSIFPDLTLTGIGSPLENGNFYFTKGVSENFPYSNLSGGEKAVFDLLLDLVLKRSFYDDTIYCIDEPESHLNTRVQAALLEEMLQLIPPHCQLWIASHSIGMMKYARDLKRQHPEEVVFLDFEDADFDKIAELRPVAVSRDFWSRTLNTALGDLASLVAPERIVLCEGSLASSGTKNAEFDASCFRTMFEAEFPETDFISVGNERDVATDSLGVGTTIQTLVEGTEVLKVIDRDNKTPKEVEDLTRSGFRVLSRRHIESYLLDDEVLAALCAKYDQEEASSQLLELKAKSVTDSIGRGNDADDMKSIAGTMLTETRKLLRQPQLGSSKEAFLRDVLAPLMPGTTAYLQLKEDIFGSKIP